MLKAGAALAARAVPATAAPAATISVTQDGTFVRSCEPGERHLEARVGNVETSTGARQVFAAVAGADTDIAALTGLANAGEEELCSDQAIAGRPVHVQT